MQGYLAAGFDAAKIKIRKPDLAEDLERANAVRNLIGTAIAFTVDANYSYGVPTVIEIGKRPNHFDLTSFEEPVISR